VIGDFTSKELNADTLKDIKENPPQLESLPSEIKASALSFLNPMPDAPVMTILATLGQKSNENDPAWNDKCYNAVMKHPKFELVHVCTDGVSTERMYLIRMNGAFLSGRTSTSASTDVNHVLKAARNQIINGPKDLKTAGLYPVDGGILAQQYEFDGM
jgi:hypothetical protein